MNEHRLLRGPDRSTLQSKARVQVVGWAQHWDARQAREEAVRARNRVAGDRQAQKLYAESRKQEATDRTAAPKAALERLRGTLAHTLDHDDAIRWEALKPADPYVPPKPLRVGSLRNRPRPESPHRP